ncbi:MAG: hypothetical protein ACKO9Q_00525, partial [Pirellula sp.]
MFVKPQPNLRLPSRCDALNQGEADGQMNRPPRCLAAWGVAYFVVLGRTRALVDDFEEIIYVLWPLDMVTMVDGQMNRPPRCLAAWGVAYFVVLGRTR